MEPNFPPLGSLPDILVEETLDRIAREDVQPIVDQVRAWLGQGRPRASIASLLMGVMVVDCDYPLGDPTPQFVWSLIRIAELEIERDRERAAKC